MTSLGGTPSNGSVFWISQTQLSRASRIKPTRTYTRFRRKRLRQKPWFKRTLRTVMQNNPDVEVTLLASVGELQSISCAFGLAQALFVPSRSSCGSSEFAVVTPGTGGAK